MLTSRLVRNAVSRLPRSQARVVRLLTRSPEKRVFVLTGWAANVRMLLDTADPFQALMAFGAYQPQLVSTLAKLARAGDHVLVAGAHVGYMPLLLASMGCDVTAFEAAPHNIEACGRNLELNPGLKVDLLPFGLSDTEAEIPMWVATIGSNSSFCVHHGSGSEARALVKRGDQMIERAVDGILLDVEGWEVHALKGLTRTIAKHQPRWAAIECASWALGKAGSSVEELSALIEALGWRIEARVGNDLICVAG